MPNDLEISLSPSVRLSCRPTSTPSKIEYNKNYSIFTKIYSCIAPSDSNKFIEYQGPRSIRPSVSPSVCKLLFALYLVNYSSDIHKILDTYCPRSPKLKPKISKLYDFLFVCLFVCMFVCLFVCKIFHLH